MAFEATLRDLIIEIVRMEVLPSMRAEIRTLIPARLPLAEQPAAVLTVADAAMILKVAPDTVQNWIRAGALAAFKLPGGREYRIRWECLENLMSDGPGTTSALDTQDEAARILSVARGKMKTGGG